MRRLLTIIAQLVLLACVLSVIAQDEVAGRKGSVDDELKAGFEAVSKKNYSEARKRFETGLVVMAKNPEPSQWLFTKIKLADEDSSVESKDRMVQGITAWRHSMGTKQALLMFAGFAAQLEGDPKLAAKYIGEVYGMQGPMWGLSWRAFIPPLQALYYASVAPDESDNYARYLALNGRLLWSSGESETGLKLVRETHRRLPKDPEIAAMLAGYLVIRLEAAEAKKLAEIALAANPKQERVLIDLAVAEWLLGDTEAAAKHASEAKKLAPDLPGPHATLALVAVERNDLASAAKDAKSGVELSDRHPFYLLIQAIVFEASGKKKEAEQTIREAWGDSLPDSKDLKHWYMRGKAMTLAAAVLGRLKK